MNNISLDTPLGLYETGSRSENEDYIFPLPGRATARDTLFLVCDGVGGASKGEVASRILAESIVKYVSGHLNENGHTQAFLTDALRHAEANMSQQLAQHPEYEGMGTTLSLLYLGPEGATIAWVGDSRVYHFRQGRCLFRTQDHSLVGELLKNGNITEAQARTHPQKNVILRAVKGSEHPAKPDFYHTSDVQPGDFFLLCTDGVVEAFDDAALQQLFNGQLTAPEILQQLKAGCRSRSTDNYSAYIVPVADTAGRQTVSMREEPARTTGRQAAPTTKGRNSYNRLIRYALIALVLYGVYALFKKDNTQDAPPPKREAPAPPPERESTPPPGINTEASTPPEPAVSNEGPEGASPTSTLPAAAPARTTDSLALDEASRLKLEHAQQQIAANMEQTIALIQQQARIYLEKGHCNTARQHWERAKWIFDNFKLEPRTYAAFEAELQACGQE